MQRPSFFKRFRDSVCIWKGAVIFGAKRRLHKGTLIMADHSDERTSALPLIVGVLAALTVGYWLFHGGSASEQKAETKPAAASHQ
jgi:hypothetical protein